MSFVILHVQLFNKNKLVRPLISFRLPEPEPLRHNISNYINTAKKVATSTKGTASENNEENDEITSDDNENFIIRESEIGPEVTHIYQIENKVNLYTHCFKPET